MMIKMMADNGWNDGELQWSYTKDDGDSWNDDGEPIPWSHMMVHGRIDGMMNDWHSD